MSTISSSTTSTTAYKVTADTTGTLVIQTGATPTTAVTVDASQNVGIGTSSPANKLDIVGSSNIFGLTNTSASGYEAINMTVGTQQARILLTGQSFGDANYGTGDLTIQAQTSGKGIRFGTSGNTNQMLIDSSGNVGIGTSSPTGKLHIYNSTSGSPAILNINSVNGGGGTTGIYFRPYQTDTQAASNPAQAAIYAIDSNYSANLTFNIKTAGAIGNSLFEAARIDSSGHLLVGTTSADGAAVGIRLFSTNQVQASKSGDWSFRMGRRDSTGIVTEIYYNSTRVGDIATNGTGTTYNSASDYRLKENVQPMVGALERVALLKPCTYTWKINGSTGEGFIAHELQEIVPDAVNGIKDAVDTEGNIVPQSIDTSFLVATLTAAIQEQQALITALTARIEALTDRITALEAK